jgi:hypothetical protein
MTSYSTIYDAFLSKVLEDEWGDWEIHSVEKDLNQILKSSVVWFKFPKVSLEMGPEGFVEDLNNLEIQIIATYMKCEWLNRSIMTWENVKPLYEERDFSQANLLNRLVTTLENERKNALKLESIYYRKEDGKPFPFTRLAGG